MLASLFALNVTFLEADEVVDTKLLLQMPDTNPHEVVEVAVLVEVDEAALLLVVMTLLLPRVVAEEEVVVVC